MPGAPLPAESGGDAADLVVVVPFRNEAERVGACLSSVADQDVHVRVLCSDNASADGSRKVVDAFGGRLDLKVRTTRPMGPSEHFVSAARWALAQAPEADCFALLAGDDTWTTGFAAACLDVLRRCPEAAVAFPTFVWQGEGARERRLHPVSLMQPRGGRRQLRALVLPDARELSNLVYGVYRRDAFSDLVAAWERGGDEFAADYAAAWSVLGGHRVAAVPDAVGIRHLRAGADLVERVGLRRPSKPVMVAVFYLRLNFRINRLIATALGRAAADRRAPSPWLVQLLRAPQWLAGVVQQLRAVARRPGR